MQIEQRALDAIKPYDKNPRRNDSAVAAERGVDPGPAAVAASVAA